MSYYNDIVLSEEGRDDADNFPAGDPDSRVWKARRLFSWLDQGRRIDILAVPLLLYLVGYHGTHVVIGVPALAVALTAFANVMPHWRATRTGYRHLPLLYLVPWVPHSVLRSERRFPAGNCSSSSAW